MAHDIIMPVLGMNQDTGIIADWLKQPGEWVNAGDAVMSVETDKAVQDIESRYEGYLSHVKFPAGAEVPVGDVVAQLTAEPVTEEEQAAEVPAVKEEEKAVESTEAPDAVAPEKVTPAKAKSVPMSSSNGKILASPKAKRLAVEKDISLKDMVANGAVQPIHALEVGNYSPRVAAVARTQGKISATIDPAMFISTEQWLGSESVEISRAELLAFLSVGTLRYMDVIQEDFDCLVSIPDENVSLLNPDKSGLKNLEKTSDDDGYVSVWDFTESAISDFELDSSSQLNLSFFGRDIWTVELRFDTQIVSSKQAVAIVTELTQRISQPLRQLL